MKTAISLLFAITVAAPAFGAASSEWAGEPSCRFAKPVLKKDETVAWKGQCAEGYAAGAGVMELVRPGVFSTASARYEVTMVQGQISGDGVIKYKNGDKYTGGIQDGLRSGKGHTAYANGGQYEGDYRHDVPNGVGIWVAHDGSRYEGGWKDGRFDGAGSMSFALGGRYDGTWKAGKFDGKGTLTYAGSGKQFAGEFENGRVRGKPAPEHEQEQEQSFGMKRDDALVGSMFRPIVAHSPIPFDKAYGELTPAQQAMIKRQYFALEDGDEPPFPEKGTKLIHESFNEAASKLQVEGDLRVYVMVGKDGNAMSVTTIETPTPEMAKVATVVLGKQKYKPAVCRGEPCAMMFPFTLKISRKSMYH